MRTVSQRIFHFLWPLVIGIIIVLVLNRMEHKFDPVISKFLVTELNKTPDQIRMSGFLLKARDCQFAGVTAQTTRGGVTVPLYFRDSRNHTGSRPAGYQAWGPWEMAIPITPTVSGETIDLYQIHQCHPFWQTRSFLTSIPTEFD